MYILNAGSVVEVEEDSRLGRRLEHTYRAYKSAFPGEAAQKALVGEDLARIRSRDDMLEVDDKL